MGRSLPAWWSLGGPDGENVDFSLTEVSSKGSHFAIKEGGYTETDTKREAFAVSGPPRIAIALFQNDLKIRVSKIYKGK